MYLRFAFVFALSIVLFALTGCNSVSKADIESIKPGNKITYRFQRDGKSWFYADKVTRVEDEMIFYNASKSESTSGSDARLDEYDTTRELSIKKSEIVKFETEQPPNDKKIIWIQ